MPQLDLFKQDGTKVGAVEANEAVFGIEQINTFPSCNFTRASLRQVHTHKTKDVLKFQVVINHGVKNRSLTRQDLSFTTIAGGGIVFGPTPRSYSFKNAS